MDRGSLGGWGKAWVDGGGCSWWVPFVGCVAHMRTLIHPDPHPPGHSSTRTLIHPASQMRTAIHTLARSHTQTTLSGRVVGQGSSGRLVNQGSSGRVVSQGSSGRVVNQGSKGRCGRASWLHGCNPGGMAVIQGAC